MNLAEFRDRVDSDGSDLSRWPDERRIAAERLLALDAAARVALDEARRLDGLIARVMQPDAPAALLPRAGASPRSPAWRASACSSVSPDRTSTVTAARRLRHPKQCWPRCSSPRP